MLLCLGVVNPPCTGVLFRSLFFFKFTFHSVYSFLIEIANTASKYISAPFLLCNHHDVYESTCNAQLGNNSV